MSTGTFVTAGLVGVLVGWVAASDLAGSVATWPVRAVWRLVRRYQQRKGNR